MSLVVESMGIQKRIIIDTDDNERMRVNLVVEGEAVVKIKLEGRVKHYVITVGDFVEKRVQEVFNMESEFKELEDKVSRKLSESIANLSKVLEEADRQNIPVFII